MTATQPTIYSNFNRNTEARAHYSRRQLTRAANGRLVYEPRLSIQAFTNKMYTTSYALRVNGNLIANVYFDVRADAVKELRRLARFWWRGEAGTPETDEF